MHSMQNKLPIPSLFILLILILLLPVITFAASMSIAFDVSGKSREEAEFFALVDATQQALKVFMAEQALDPSMQQKIEARLKQIKPRQYKPYVRRWLLNLDEAGNGKHFLEGKVVLDSDSLTLWSKQWLVDLSSPDAQNPPKIKHRLTLYVSPVSSDDLVNNNINLELRQELMNALKQQLSHRGYEIKTKAQKNQAQYVLQLQKSRYQLNGAMGTIDFTVAVLENRADRSQIGFANDVANAALLTTELSLQKELFKRSAKKVAAELQYVFEELANTKSGLELVFYAPKGMQKRKVNRASDNGFDSLADIFGITDDKGFLNFEAAVDYETFQVEDGWFVSYKIADQFASKSKLSKQTLSELHREMFATTEISVHRALAGKKWLIYEAENPPTGIGSIKTSDTWQIKTERLIRQGNLDQPPGIGANALDTLKAQLEKKGDDAAAQSQLNRIAEHLLSSSLDALTKNQFGSAQRYLNRAERVFAAEKFNPSAATNKLQKQATSALIKAKQVSASSTPTPPVKYKGNTKPTIVFPEIEAKLLGSSLDNDQKIIVLVAAAEGIEHVTAGGKIIKPGEVDGQYQTFIDIPNTSIQQLSLPNSLLGNSEHVEITATDRRGNTKTRTLRNHNGKVNVVVPDALQKGRDVLEKGDYWALLISNQHYDYRKPSTANDDSEAIKMVLENQYGFKKNHIAQFQDAVKQEMENAFDQILEKIKTNDSLLIYYAGLGYQDSGPQGQCFWIPINGSSPDAVDNSRSKWLANDIIQEKLDASLAKHILLISDSCYSGSFRTKSTLNDSAFSSGAEFLYDLAGKKSRRAITSGDLEPIVDESGSGHSVFSQQLINALKNGQHAINGSRLINLVRQPVQNRSEQLGIKQTPQYFLIEPADDQGGNFIFIPSS